MPPCGNCQLCGPAAPARRPYQTRPSGWNSTMPTFGRWFGRSKRTRFASASARLGDGGSGGQLIAALRQARRPGPDLGQGDGIGEASAKRLAVLKGGGFERKQLLV